MEKADHEKCRRWAEQVQLRSELWRDLDHLRSDDDLELAAAAYLESLATVSRLQGESEAADELFGPAYEMHPTLAAKVERLFLERDEMGEDLAAALAEVERLTETLAKMGDDVQAKVFEKAAAEERCQRLEAEVARLREASAEPPTWWVNDIGELGVMVRGRLFFLYKGDSLEYMDQEHDGGGEMMVRRVGKREFGEVCHPRDWWPVCDECRRAQCNWPDRYTAGDGWKPARALLTKGDDSDA